jgi:DNA-binding CsgD family transcriptional regulator
VFSLVVAPPLRAGSSQWPTREQQVLALVGRGMSNHEIARSLSLAGGTVKAHVSAILLRPGLNNRVQAAILAHEAGLINDRTWPEFEVAPELQALSSATRTIDVARQIEGMSCGCPSGTRLMRLGEAPFRSGHIDGALASRRVVALALRDEFDPAVRGRGAGEPGVSGHESKATAFRQGNVSSVVGADGRPQLPHAW